MMRGFLGIGGRRWCSLGSGPLSKQASSRPVASFTSQPARMAGPDQVLGRWSSGERTCWDGGLGDIGRYKLALVRT